MSGRVSGRSIAHTGAGRGNGIGPAGALDAGALDAGVHGVPVGVLADGAAAVHAEDDRPAVVGDPAAATGRGRPALPAQLAGTAMVPAPADPDRRTDQAGRAAGGMVLV